MARVTTRAPYNVRCSYSVNQLVSKVGTGVSSVPVVTCTYMYLYLLATNQMMVTMIF